MSFKIPFVSKFEDVVALFSLINDKLKIEALQEEQKRIIDYLGINSFSS
jgi:hypothetical protein